MPLIADMLDLAANDLPKWNGNTLASMVNAANQVGIGGSNRIEEIRDARVAAIRSGMAYGNAIDANASAMRRAAESIRQKAGITKTGLTVRLTDDQLCALRELLALVHYDDLAREWLDLLPAELHPARTDRKS
jgi:hypothetical protein